MNQRILLVNSSGQTIRVFGAVPKGDFFIVSVEGLGLQLRLMESVEALRRKKVKFQVLMQTSFRELKQKSQQVFLNHSLVAVEDEAFGVVVEPAVKSEKDHWSSAITVLTVAILLLLGVGVYLDMAQMPEDVVAEEELKPKTVTIQKKKVITTPLRFRAVPKKVASVKRKSLKRMGALGVLGQLNKSKQKGGINLGKVQTSKGIGLGGLKGSGGVQKSLYAKGVVNAPLGEGNNIQGAGGYGTKGKGGGQAGYGKLSMLGAAGDSAVPTVSRSDKDSGISDGDVAAVVNKNIGQIRFCYEQGLQSEPGLSGRVSVDWVIDGHGSVKAAGVRHSTMHSRSVESCMLKKIRAWKFPLPKGGVDVKVSFPFLLKRTG